MTGSAGNSPAGVLAPSQAFDPAEVLDALAPAGITWSVEETPAPLTPLP